MRFGYTTGSCATAAAKAAIGLCKGNIPDEVEIDTPHRYEAGTEDF